MPSCCQCNGHGKCSNCSCVKAGQLCCNCIPSKLGTCSNLPQKGIQITSSPSAINLRSIEVTSSDATDTSIVEETPSSHSGPNHLGIHQPVVSSSIPSPNLPTFTPLVSPIFTWGSLDATSFIDLINGAFDALVKECFPCAFWEGW